MMKPSHPNLIIKNMRPMSRLLRSIEINQINDCWEWQGATYKGGYGRLSINGVIQSAHRLAYKLFKGTIPVDLHVLHRCDNPRCVNPSHLEIGTHRQNMIDKVSRGRHRNAYLKKSF